MDSQWIVHQRIPSLGNQVVISYIESIQPMKILPVQAEHLNLSGQILTGRSDRREETLGTGKLMR